MLILTSRSLSTKPGGAAGGGATPTQLAITTQPSGAASGSAFTTQPVIEVRDVNNNRVTTATNSVDVAVNTGSSTLSGTHPLSAVNGIVSFSDLALTGVDTDTLIFTSSGLTSAVSNSINVTGTWANEPAGFTVIKETNWSFAIPTGSSDQLCSADPTNPQWRTIYNNNQAGSGGATGTDGTAPLDSGNVFIETYASGFSGGSAPDTLYFDHTTYSHVYFGYYAFWPSGWQPNSPSGVSKSLFWFTGTGSDSMDVQM